MIERCCETLNLRVYVLVRPRHGQFVYDSDEIAIRVKDISVAKALAYGVVIVHGRAFRGMLTTAPKC